MDGGDAEVRELVKAAVRSYVRAHPEELVVVARRLARPAEPIAETARYFGISRQSIYRLLRSVADVEDLVRLGYGLDAAALRLLGSRL